MKRYPHQPPILVVYLELEGWEDKTERFVDSLQRFATDMDPEHRLEFFHKKPGGDDGYGSGAMLKIAEIGRDLGYETVVYLGSYSRILDYQWLRKMTLPLVEMRAGAVCATGSYEQGCASRWPNPHLRNSAMAFDPRILLGAWDSPWPRTKAEEFEFEHGDDSVFRRMQARGKELVVAGKTGHYSPGWWPTSGTYRHDDQRNLLIADNVTDLYDDGDQALRDELERRCWHPA